MHHGAVPPAPPLPQCPICLNDCVVTTDPRLNCCNQFIHGDCMNDWVVAQLKRDPHDILAPIAWADRGRVTCPLCNQLVVDLGNNQQEPPHRLAVFIIITVRAQNVAPAGTRYTP